MYLDFGVDNMIKANEIIAIIDKKSFETATDTNELLNHSIHHPKGTFKSIIITNNHIYFSPFASSTLIKRIQKQSVST